MPWRPIRGYGIYLGVPFSLELQNLTKSFNGVTVLDKINLKLENEIHAIVGKNGAGKSTLVNILIGALRPDDGVISINNEHVNFKDPRDALKYKIAMVFQELALFPNLSIERSNEKSYEPL